MCSAPSVSKVAVFILLGIAFAVPASVDAQDDIVRRRSAARSNVGYVDSAIPATQFQLRYDGARGADRPDLAEFIYGKCGCFGGDAPGPIGNLPAGADPLVTPLIEFDLDYHEVVLDGEFAFHDRASVFAEVPFRFTRGQVIPNSNGIADVAFGVKAAAVAADDRFLTFQLRTYVPTGDAAKGLGTDHLSLEPAVLFHQRGPEDRLAFEAEARLWIPIGGSSNENTPPEVTNEDYAGSVFRYGVGLGYDMTPDAEVRLTPVFELVGWRVLGGIGAFSPDGTPSNLVVEDADGVSIVNMKVGARIGIRETAGLFVGWGKALSQDHWYDSIFRVEYRFAP